jgi:peptide/nickel transport system permease protein
MQRSTFHAYKKSFREFWWGYSGNRAAVLGLIVVAIFALIAIAAPLMTSYDPLAIGVAPRFEPPSVKYPMGTDDLGRDVLAGVIYGAQISMLVGLVSAGGSGLIGLLVGALSGYVGGLFDDLVMRVTEMFQTIPRLFFIILVVALWGPTELGIVATIIIFSWPVTARVVRAQVYALKEKELVMAARSIGENDMFILFREIVPNAMSSVIVTTSLQVASAILVEASLAFLGLGDPNVKSWGRMLSESQAFLRNAWWMMFFPGIAIFLVVLGFNLVGDGLNDALNPRSKDI